MKTGPCVFFVNLKISSLWKSSNVSLFWSYNEDLLLFSIPRSHTDCLLSLLITSICVFSNRSRQWQHNSLWSQRPAHSAGAAAEQRSWHAASSQEAALQRSVYLKHIDCFWKSWQIWQIIALQLQKCFNKETLNQYWWESVSTDSVPSPPVRDTGLFSPSSPLHAMQKHTEETGATDQGERFQAAFALWLCNPTHNSHNFKHENIILRALFRYPSVWIILHETRNY